MKKALCAGLACCDIPLRPVSADIMGQDACSIELPRYASGGDALNVSVCFAKLGMDSMFCGLVGKDSNGDFIERCLRNAGVDVRGLKRHPSIGTAVSYILIEENGSRHFVFYGDIHRVMNEKDIDSALIEEADLAYFGSALAMDNMDNGGAAAYFKTAHRCGKLTAADTAVVQGGRGSGYYRERLAPMLGETDIFLPSYDEAAAIAGSGEMGAIRQFFSRFPLRLLVIKLGAKGAYVTDFKGEWTIPTFSEFEVLDTTGAGDSFVAGFLLGILSGWLPRDAAFFGNAVASHNVTKLGATGGVPDFDTVYRYVTRAAGGTERFPR